MGSLIDFILFQILDKAPVFLGLVVLVGLLLQKKAAPEVIDGVVKTVVGLLILTAGAGILLSAIGPVMTKLNAVLGVKGVVPANEAAFGVAMADALGLANAITMTFLLGFLIHLCIVAIVPFKNCKNVYLTVHIMLFLSTFLNISLPGVLGLKGVPLIVVSAIFCALYWTFSPAITRVLGRSFLGDDLTLGHHQQFGALLASWIAPLFGNPKDDADDMQQPGFLSIFRDTTISLAILMPLIFLGIGFAVGPAGIGALAGKSNWIVWLFLEGLRFTAGVVILLQGVRMFIASIVPAFKGISDRLLPNTTPALDSPAIYPYSPTGAMLGFISSVVAAIGRHDRLHRVRQPDHRLSQPDHHVLRWLRDGRVRQQVRRLQGRDRGGLRLLDARPCWRHPALSAGGPGLRLGADVLQHRLHAAVAALALHPEDRRRRARAYPLSAGDRIDPVRLVEGKNHETATRPSIFWTKAMRWRAARVAAPFRRYRRSRHPRCSNWPAPESLPSSVPSVRERRSSST